jgi:hypothetical protein
MGLDTMHGLEIVADQNAELLSVLKRFGNVDENYFFVQIWMLFSEFVTELSKGLGKL